MSRFRIIAGLILAWNLIGCAMYLAQSTMDLETLAKSDPQMAQTFAAMPAWAWSGYAVAVWLGAAGGLALVLRRKIAALLFTGSLLGELTQFGWTFLGHDLIGKQGASTLAFPLLIIAITAASIWYSRIRTAMGTLR